MRSSHVMAGMLAACGLAGVLFAAEAATAPADVPEFTQDYTAAVAQAKKDHKLLMLEFTGSDWCVPCQNLEHTVFTTPAYTDWAKAVVPVMLDYPTARKKIDDAIKTRNAALKTQYKIEGYPTILIIDPATDKELARTLGFADNETANQWLTDIKSQIAKNSPANNQPAK